MFPAARAVYKGVRFKRDFGDFQGVQDKPAAGRNGGYVKSFGCQMNVYDSARIGGLLETAGFDPRARAEDCDGPIVTLATAHPAKFPDAVERATGIRPGLPPHMADLFAKPERVTRVSNDLAALQALVRERIAR